MIKQSFTLRVLVISFIVIALPLLISSFIFFQMSYYEAIDDAKMMLRDDANLRTFTLYEIENAKKILFEELEYLFDISEKITNLKHEELNRELAEIAHLGGDFQIYILDTGKDFRYKIIASSVLDDTDTYFISYLRLKEAMEAGEGIFIRYVYSEEERRYFPYLFLAQTIQSEKKGESIAILMIAINIQNEINSILMKSGEKDKINHAILNTDGIVVDASDPKMKGQYVNPISPARREEILSSRQIGIKRLAPTLLPITRKEDPHFFEFIFNYQMQIAYRADFFNICISVVAYSS